MYSLMIGLSTGTAVEITPGAFVAGAPVRGQSLRAVEYEFVTDGDPVCEYACLEAGSGLQNTRRALTRNNKKLQRPERLSSAALTPTAVARSAPQAAR